MRFLLIAAVTAFSTTLCSAPWVETDDLALRADIQYLADSGVISAPVTTYPLMWASIAPDIEQTDMKNLSSGQQMALLNVKRHMRIAVGKRHTARIDVYGASDAKRFTSFGDNNFDKNKVALSHEYMGDNISTKIQLNYRSSVDPDGKVNQGQKATPDGSYLAFKAGNWVVAAGAVDKWWGPGLDTSLIMSSNARPLPALSLTRNGSQAFETPWLSWVGPWTFTAQMARMEKGRVVSEPYLFSTRATARPLRGIELGLSWSYQWGGEGQPGSIKDFLKGLMGKETCADGKPSSTCDESNHSKLGNQLAGVDVRWSDTLWGTPYAVYGQMIGEDSSGSGKIADKAKLYGAETRFNVLTQRILLNLEYTDTQVSCGGDEDISQNCYYEHGTYQSGYRYYRRAIGSTYDNDAETLTFTVLGQLQNGQSWQLKFRNADLNTNNSDLFPDDVNLGNTVSKVAEEVSQVDFQYRLYELGGRITAGTMVTRSTVGVITDRDYDVYLKYEVRF